MLNFIYKIMGNVVKGNFPEHGNPIHSTNYLSDFKGGNVFLLGKTTLKRKVVKLIDEIITESIQEYVKSTMENDSSKKSELENRNMLDELEDIWKEMFMQSNGLEINQAEELFIPYKKRILDLLRENEQRKKSVNF